jgi:hypothetical protein
MMEKIMLCPDRIRKIAGTFGFIEHRFLKDGFFYSLTHHELLLYLFLVLAADRDGLSFYGYDRICTFLKITLDEYILARDGLIDKDLLAFDGRTFQLLSLPVCGPTSSPVKDPAHIRQLINRSLGGSHDR